MSYIKCKNCGADYGLHHYKTSQCPTNGVEAPVGREQTWMTTTFEDCPAPKPARPTGPPPQYLRALEAELLAMKADIENLLAVTESLLFSVIPESGAGDFGAHMEIKQWATEAIAAAKGEAPIPEPAYPCEMCGSDVGDAKNLHSALAHDGNTYQVCDDCARHSHRWQEVS